jgi:hypothetical protein
MMNCMGSMVRRMQVEVSKYTEGLSDKRMRPNELPVSLIRYDGKPPRAKLLCPTLPPSSLSTVQSLIIVSLHSVGTQTGRRRRRCRR